MCWNESVSLNTFVFGLFALGLIAWNQSSAASPYKVSPFQNPYMYVFVLSVIAMQLIEFFLWRNLKNKTANQLWSTMGVLLIFCQPIASLFLISNVALRNRLLMLYSVPASVVTLGNLYLHPNIHTEVSPKGHLAWKWFLYDNTWLAVVGNLFYLLFLFASFAYNRQYVVVATVLLYVAFVYYFQKDGSAKSIWCLSVNAFMLYFLFQLLVWMPWKEIQRRF